MSVMTGNRGEWSELYVFLKLLSQGLIYAADEKVGRIDDIYYPILKIMREETKGEKTEYIIGDSEIEIMPDTGSSFSVARERFEEYSRLLIGRIIKGGNRAFQVEEVAEFAEGIRVTKLKAPSADKTDIAMRIRDINTGYVRDVGFSIKSDLGSAPTLLNASHTTNFIYSVSGLDESKVREINSISGNDKIKARTAKIKECGGVTEYRGMENAVFRRNLVMIDSCMPEIIGRMLLYSYFENERSVRTLVDVMGEEDAFGYGDRGMYEYKVKKFLSACALGMRPARPWDGLDEANGGYIIVRKDGEVLVYYIYDRNSFEQYLLDNTELERASTTRHGFMSLYEDGGETFIKLNLQIRFRT